MRHQGASHLLLGSCATPLQAPHPLRDTAPLTGRCTRSERVHCLRIGCTTHTHKHNRGERPTPRSQSPIPHAIPRRPDTLTSRKPRNSNVPTSTVETPTGELHAKCGGRARAGTQRQKRHTQHSGTQQTPAATRLRGLSFSSLPRTLQLRFHSETPRMPRCIKTRRHQRQSCNAQRASR